MVEKQEKYQLSDCQLSIIDPELEIEIQSLFTLPFLPSDLTLAFAAPNKETLVVEKDRLGQIEKAYLATAKIKHGEQRAFYPNGELKSQTFYYEGKLHGPSRYYSIDKCLLAESWYHNGLQEGKMRLYYACGKSSSLQRYKNGLREGNQEYFYDNGNLKTIMGYKKGNLHGDVRLYWSDMSPKRTISFKQGRKEGWDRIWNQKGILIDEGEYSANQPIGTHCRFYHHGALREEICYHTPEKFDKKQWDDSGELIYELVHTDNDKVIERKRQPVSSDWEEIEGKWDGAKLKFK